MNDICRTAWVKSILGGEKPFEGAEEMMEREAERLLKHNRYFELFEQLDSERFDGYYLPAKRIIEYHGEPEKIIEIGFFLCSKNVTKESVEYQKKKEEQRIVLRMNEVLPGIYTMPVGMFADEKLCYEIMEQGAARRISLFEGETVLSSQGRTERNNRFSKLQSMLLLLENDKDGQNQKELVKKVQEYEAQNYELESVLRLEG